MFCSRLFRIKSRIKGTRLRSREILMSLIGTVGLAGSGQAQNYTVDLDSDSSARSFGASTSETRLGEASVGAASVVGTNEVRGGLDQVDRKIAGDISKATGVIIRVPVDENGNEMTRLAELRVYEGTSKPEKSQLDKIFLLSGVVPDITANERGRRGNKGTKISDSANTSSTTANVDGTTVDLDADSSTGFGYGWNGYGWNGYGWNGYRGGWNSPYYYRDNYRPVYRGYRGNFRFGGSSYYSTYRSFYRQGYGYGGFNGYYNRGYRGRHFPYSRIYYWDRW